MENNEFMSDFHALGFDN